MIKETKVQRETFEYYTYCDVCGAEMNHSLVCSNAKCMYCRMDLCDRCIGHEEATGAGYRVVWCEKCWKIGNKYRARIKRLEGSVEDLYEEWKGKCGETSE